MVLGMYRVICLSIVVREMECSQWRESQGWYITDARLLQKTFLDEIFASQYEPRFVPPRKARFSRFEYR
jgi:hypothetical protein